MRGRARRHGSCLLGMIMLSVLVGGCTTLGYDREPEWDDVEEARLAPATGTFYDLVDLPPPKGRIPVAVYGFRDRTGQYRQAPQSSFSTAVTQGAGAILNDALLDSGWFRPMEREGLQDLLTERRILRQLEEDVPSLMEARLMFEGGIIAYETNVTTGGAAARYFGLGANEQYRIDQVTVNLRAINVQTGEILVSVTTTKTVYSHQLGGDLFRFVRFERLLEAELGYSRNEPRYLATSDAISAAIIHLIVQGLEMDHWRLANPTDHDHPVITTYRQAYADRQDRTSTEDKDSE